METQGIKIAVTFDIGSLRKLALAEAQKMTVFKEGETIYAEAVFDGDYFVGVEVSNEPPKD